MRKLLLLSLFTCIVCVVSAEKVDSAMLSKVMMYWPLEENGADISGNGNNAVVFDAITYEKNGKVGKAAVFTNQLGSAISTPDSIFHYGAETAYTVAFWLKMADSSWQKRVDVVQPKQGRTLLYINNSPQYQFNCSHQKKKIVFIHDSSKNEWMHIAIVMDQREGTRNHKFYVDGVLKGSQTGYELESDRIDTKSRIVFGASNDSTQLRNMHGMIDEVYMFSDTLSKEEIDVLMTWKTPYTSSVNNIKALDASIFVADKQLFIRGASANSINQVSLFDLNGKILMRESFTSDQLIKPINYNPGIYIVKLVSNNKVATRKVYIK